MNGNDLGSPRSLLKLDEHPIERRKNGSRLPRYDLTCSSRPQPLCVTHEQQCSKGIFELGESMTCARY